ncbi:hypothetical protein [Bacillus toyonensis]|uniref:hypothetical protein n=1 Tax=Bacillus toyonensis TaxID=155322 RepID=UPI002E24A5AD|nr:hypothetical protein [Bacillus toyonensis]
MFFAVYTVVFYSIEFDEFDYYEANDFKEANIFIRNVIKRGDRVLRIYDKNTPMAHYEFEKVPEDTQGVWFVSQWILAGSGETKGYYFDSVAELRANLPRLIAEAESEDRTNVGEDYVTIFPPDAMGWDLDTFEIIMMFTPN